MVERDDFALAEIHAQFDYLVDQIQEGIHPEDARLELSADAEAYLEAGCDPKMVAKFIGPLGRFKHFKLLEQYGANLDIYKIASVAKPSFVWHYLLHFLDRGANINKLLDVVNLEEYLYGLTEFYYDWRECPAASRGAQSQT